MTRLTLRPLPDDAPAAAPATPPAAPAPDALAPAPRFAAPALTPGPGVLHIRVVAGEGGGPDKTILRSARYGHEAGLRVAAAYIHPAGDSRIDAIRARAAAQGCPFYPIPESGPLDPRTVRAALQLCRTLRVAVWHGHDYKSNLLGLIVRRLWPMRLLTTAHGWTDETSRTRIYARVDRLCLRHYDHVIAVSNDLARACLASGVREQRLTYLPNGVHLQDCPPWEHVLRDRRRLEAQASHEGRPRVVGVLARLSAEKGVDRALRLFARLARDQSPLELHIVGDGPQREALESLAQELGVADRVRFLGWQPNPIPFLAAMHMLLLTSHREGLPNVVLEAMAMGVPVAATAHGDLPALLDNGACGQLLPDNESQWPAAVGAILADGDLRLELAGRARRRVEQRYDFRARARAEIDIYRRLLSVEHAGVSLSRAA